MSLIGTSSKVDQSAQPAGIPQPVGTRGTSGSLAGSDEALLELHTRLVELMPDVSERVELLGVPANVDAAWSNGRMLPVLRARRKPLQAAVQRLERAAD